MRTLTADNDALNQRLDVANANLTQGTPESRIIHDLLVQYLSIYFEMIF